MVEQNALENLQRMLKRIFTLPVTRSTFRELQKAVLTVTEGKTENANTVLNAIMIGKTEDKGLQESPVMKQIIDEFSIPTLVAKDIFERGEFVSLVTSDILSQPNRFVFVNRVRRIDGEEFQFISDVESTMHLLSHFISRLQELKNNDQGKKQLEQHKNELITLRSKIEQLIQ